MPTIVRETPKRARRRQSNAAIAPKPAVKQAKTGDDATERTIWQLRAQIEGALARIEELEAQVFILAHGGKEKDFYSVEETAQIWGMSKSHLYTMIREGRLPAVKIGESVRISRATLMKGTN